MTGAHDDDDLTTYRTFLERFMTSMTEQQQRQHIIHQYQRLTDRLARRLQHTQDPHDPFSQVIAQRHDQCNRYCDIIPYDYNRVTLTDTNLGPSDQDYINASWISFPSSRKKYIATQGPLPSTCGDFWRMVLEQHVKVIVCLTPEIERGRAKCAAYWPPDDNHHHSDSGGGMAAQFELHSQDNTRRRRRSFGHHFLYKSAAATTSWTIQVNNTQPIVIDQDAACRIRTLGVSCDRNNERMKTATVYQLEFLGWADHGVPQQTHTLNALIQLANRLQQQQQQQQGPMVVHCSAGCGRTGTFCVVDTALACLSDNDKQQQQQQQQVVVDDDDDDLIYQITDVFRQQRTTMVQTPAQYHFCYQAIWDQLQQQQQQ